MKLNSILMDHGHKNSPTTEFSLDQKINVMHAKMELRRNWVKKMNQWKDGRSRSMSKSMLSDIQTNKTHNNIQVSEIKIF